MRMRANKNKDNSPHTTRWPFRLSLPHLLVVLILSLALLAPFGGTSRAQTSTLFGTVTAPDGATPVEGADIQIVIPETNRTIAWGSTILDGSFALPLTALETGDYVLRVNPPPGTGYWSAKDADFTLSDLNKDVDAGVIILSYPQVEGMLETPEGERASSDSVNLLNAADEKVSLWDTTAPDKPFRFGGAPAGKYTLQVFLPADSPYWPPNPVEVELTETHVTDASGTKSVTLKLGYPQVEGFVVGVDGKTRIQADSVNLISLDGETSLWSSATETEPFRFGGAPPGDYLLQVYLPEGSEEEAPPAIRVTIPYTTDKPLTQHFSLRLSYSQIEGMVYMPDGVTRAGKWDVNLTPAPYSKSLTGTLESLAKLFPWDLTPMSDYSSWATGTSTQTFKFGGLPPGYYLLQAHPIDAPDLTPSALVPVKIEEEAYTQEGKQIIDLTLTYPQMKGYVTAPDGSPVSGGNMRLVKADDENVETWGTSYAWQPYSFSSLPPGKYRATAQPPEGSQYWESDTVELTIGKEVVTDTADILNLDVPLTYPQLKVTVVTTDGVAPAQGVDVYAQNLYNGSTAWGVQGADGAFALGGMDPAVYRIWVNTPDGSRLWRPDTVDITVSPESKYSPPQEMKLQLQEADVEGFVYYLGKPVKGAGVGVYNFSGEISNFTTSGSDGYFAIGGLRAERYTLAVEAATRQYAGYWLGPTAPVLFTLTEEEAADGKIRNLGVIDLQLWSPFLNNYMERE